ncbi:uncharacterized protein LOC143042088 [Mytilus galloprovincialis]|uniref:uncharacterized protein LOC143042088 n=1 Tax=Mytilus galloprovincialis TaxID=29158 RepID=UPI003F7CA2C4
MAERLRPEDLGVNVNLGEGDQIVFTADDDESLDEDDDDFHFASDQQPMQPVTPTRQAPSSTFQFTTGQQEPRYHPAQPLQPIQPVQPFGFSQQFRPAPIQPRPEYIEIHKTPKELTPETYLQESEVTLWNNFFQTTPMNPEEMYYERYYYNKARKTLWYNGYVTIVGFCGDGKSSMAEHLMISFIMKPKALKWGSHAGTEREFKENSIPESKRELYECIYVNSPEEWYMKVDRNKKQVIIVDDIFGEAATSMHKIEPWIPHLDTMVQTAIDNKPNLLLITTCHKHQFDKLPSFVTRKRIFSTNHLIDLTAPKPGYSDQGSVIEKICEYYDFKMGFRDRDELQYDQVKEGFPIKCRLFAAVKSFHMEGKQYFANPSRAFENVIQKVYNFDKIIFYTLAVAVLFDGKLDLDKEVFEQYTDREQKIFRELIEPLEISREVNLGKMRFAATLLNGVFFVPKQLHCWVFCHEHVMHLVAESINRKIPKKIVELCSHDFLMERCRTGNYFGGKMESYITVWPKEHSQLAQRFVFEILSGNVRLIASHSALNNEKCSKDFFEFMGEMGSLLPVIQQKGPFNRSLFFWAAFYGQEATVRQYLTNEELKEFKEEQWFQDELQAALFAVCYGTTISHGKMVKLLLDEGAPLTSTENLADDEFKELYGDDLLDLMKLKPTLMHIAAQFGSGETIKTLKQKGLDINAALEDGYTPMHLAVRNTDDGAARALMDLKCDLEAETPNGHKPIHEALLAGKESIVRQLHYNDKERLNKTTMEGNRSLLHAAACTGDKQIVTLVQGLGTGCRGNSVFDPWSPLAEAAAQGDLEIVRYLVENNAEVNQSGISGWTALHFATLFYHEDIVNFLLSKGADVNSTTSTKISPLHLAAENGYSELCHILLDKGAKPEMLTSQGEFALTLAAKNGHFHLLQFFLDEGIELPLPQEREITPSQKDEILIAIMQRAGPEYKHRYMFM